MRKQPRAKRNLRGEHKSHISGKRWYAEAGSRGMEEKLDSTVKKIEREIRTKQIGRYQPDLSDIQLQERVKKHQNREDHR